MKTFNCCLAEKLLFLPGASGNIRFWQPVSDLISHPGYREFFGWPGFGGVPRDATVRCFDDLVASVAASITCPTDILAQSMGGAIAIKVALQQQDLVKHLVLSVTSGGIDMASFGAMDWQNEFKANNPLVPDWFYNVREDLSSRLCELKMPVLLLWGDNDPISPVAVGSRLNDLLPNSELVIIQNGTHGLVNEQAATVAPLIEKHLVF